MSVIIGVCGRNFTSLWADMRLVQYADHKVNSVTDDMTKIFRVNSNVLFGATGYFGCEEDVRDAISNLASPETASVKVCKDAILSFLKMSQKAGRVLPIRNYILAGKQKDGTFIMYSIHWNPEIGKVKTTQYYPYNGTDNFGVVLALPEAQAQFQKDCKDSANRLVLESKTYEDLDVGMTTLIREISRRNPTVSPKSMSLCVK